MQVQRHQRKTTLLHLADQLTDFLRPQQQFTRARGIWLDMRGGRGQRADVHAKHVNLGVSHNDVALFNLGSPGTNGLDLPTFKHHTSFEALVDEVVVKRFSIVNDAHKTLRLREPLKSPHSSDLCELMHSVERSVLVPYSAAQMFDLVAAVDRYPEFMPWCGGSQIHWRTDEGMQASVTIALAGIKQTFSTRNHHQYPGLIELELVEGPFSALNGRWEFQSLSDSACKVVFTLRYEFSSRALEKLVGPIFNRIANSFIDSFTQRADACYGNNS
jgi:ribosome-associated toxin RatA of RatAB toxin-antitoxin module